MKKSLIFLAFISSRLCAQQLTIESLGIKLDHQITANPVQDQSMSSTCWSFASNSFIESELIRKKQPVKLSEMFIARYSYINKVVQYLIKKGKVFFTPGGQFHDVTRVIKEYGMVPEEAYSGLLKTNTGYYYNHNMLDSVMQGFANKLLAQGKHQPSDEDLAFINETLDIYIGKVPKTFIYKGKQYTAISFARDLLHFNPSDYIELTSYTHHPMYLPYILEDKYNWTMDKYYNVPVSDFSAITNNALNNGYTVEWDGDTEEPGFRYDAGLAYLPNVVTNFQKERQTTYEDKTTALDHMMHIIGTATDKNNARYYYVKNSWGNTNNLGGYLFMKDDYFKVKTVAIIVNKNAIPASIRRKLKI